ncbi:MAG: hypothetical protein K2X68_03365, partial [Novosphingobium sp.]|nr:hypothetical protein [Novosphingobium sp.]
MTTSPSARSEARTAGVLGRIFRRTGMTPPSGGAGQPVVTPMPMLAALEALAAARGIGHAPAVLGAALPMAQESLAAKLAPLALA